jgi:uncharacterized protein (DUF2164 family)
MAKRNMKIALTGERRARMLRSIRKYFSDHLDRELGELAAGLLLDFFVRELGAPVYNQAIQDARAFVQQRLDDLEVEFYEPEEPYSR